MRHLPAHNSNFMIPSKLTIVALYTWLFHDFTVLMRSSVVETTRLLRLVLWIQFCAKNTLSHCSRDGQHQHQLCGRIPGEMTKNTTGANISYHNCTYAHTRMTLHRFVSEKHYTYRCKVLLYLLLLENVTRHGWRRLG